METADVVEATFHTLVDGQTRTVEVVVGQSLMLGAKAAKIPGIEAVCGGAMACGTCMVHVDPDWIDRLEPATDAELEIVEFAVDPQPTSRLSCQIVMRPDLSGLKVAVPASQV